LNRLVKRAGEKPSLWQRIKNLALTDVGVLVKGLDHGSLEKLEELLLAADFGVPATMRLVDHVEDLSRRGKIKTEQEFLDTVSAEIAAILEAGNASPALTFAITQGSDPASVPTLVVTVRRSPTEAVFENAEVRVEAPDAVTSTIAESVSEPAGMTSWSSVPGWIWPEPKKARRPGAVASSV